MLADFIFLIFMYFECILPMILRPAGPSEVPAGPSGAHRCLFRFVLSALLSVSWSVLLSVLFVLLYVLLSVVLFVVLAIVHFCSSAID